MPEWMTGVDLQMPAEKLMGVRVLDAAPGAASGVQAGATPGAHAATFSLGWFGVISDAMGGRPVAFSIPDGESLSTVSMHLDLVREPTPEDLAVLAGAGRLLELGRSWGLSGITVTGADSRALVVGTVRFLTYPMGKGAGGSRANGTAGSAESPAPGPVVRDGNLMTLLGMALEDVTNGRATLTFTPERRHANPFPVVHGGLHTALVDAAMTAALTDLPGAEGMTLLSLDLTYLRPIPVDRNAVRVTAEVLQRGRRSALAEATIVASNGKALTTARGTFGLLAPE